jgi:hypothetical protein
MCNSDNNGGAQDSERGKKGDELPSMNHQRF